MLFLRVLALSFLISVSIWLSLICLSFSLFVVIFHYMLVFIIMVCGFCIQQSELNRGCCFINGSYCWCWLKVIWGNWKALVFFIYWFYVYFIKFLIPLDFIYSFSSVISFSIWSCKISLVILWYCLILVISLNMLFVLASCLLQILDSVDSWKYFVMLKAGCYLIW